MIRFFQSNILCFIVVCFNLTLGQYVAFGNEEESSSKTCETLKATLSYKQENAPQDISDVLRIVVEKVNSEISGVLDVDVNWSGVDIHRVVGDHSVHATVTRILPSSNSEVDGRETVTQCFIIPFKILDTNECTLPVGHTMRHRCRDPSVCVNTVGSYECLCPFVSQSDDAAENKIDPLTEHNQSMTPSEDFWIKVAQSTAIRTPWDLSLSLTSSVCHQLPSTKGCCGIDAHTVSGRDCRSSFRCPIDPCNKNSTGYPCNQSAECRRSVSPLGSVSSLHTCVCPPKTIGNGKKCRPGIDPIPQPKVGFDGITPTSDTLQNLETYCGCTVPTIDPCSGFPPCSHKNEICMADPKTNEPKCECKDGYVSDEKFGCVDLTPPRLKLRCDDNNDGLMVLKRGDLYTECAVDILDENAEEYARNLKIAYSRPMSPGKCLAEMGTFTVNYTVATPWTSPPFVGVVRTVEIQDRNVCEIPRNQYIKFCPEILPKCDVNNGASCVSKRGGWSCKCPDGMVGDGVLLSEGGTSCIDYRKPEIELLGANPRVFKLCGCSGLGGSLDASGSANNENLVESRENKIKRYNADLLKIIKSSAEELCTTTVSTGSNIECVKAIDENYLGVVDLTNRVVIGDPIFVESSSKESGKFVWNIPYDVIDDAGNKAITSYREIQVVEMSIEALEESLKNDMLEAKKIEIQNAVDEALREERKKNKMSLGSKEKACPVCPKCMECRSVNGAKNNGVPTPESCKSICDTMNQNQCSPPSGNVSSGVETSSPGGGFLFYLCGFIFLVYCVYSCLSYGNNESSNVSVRQDEYDRELYANSVQYFHSPQAQTQPTNSRVPYRVERVQKNGSDGNVGNGINNDYDRPPSMSMSYSGVGGMSSPPLFSSRENRGMTPNRQQEYHPSSSFPEDEKDIYYNDSNQSIITPSRSDGKNRSTHENFY